jgi:hypothetical protein
LILILSPLSVKNFVVASSMTLLKSTGGSPAFCAATAGCLNPISAGLIWYHRALRLGDCSPGAAGGSFGCHGSSLS